MTWYACVGVLVYISKTSFMKQFFLFLHAVYSDIFYSS